MAIIIVDNFSLGSDIPLDIRYRADTYNDVSAYWYEGMQVYQYTDKQIWWYNGVIWQTLASTSNNPFDILNGGNNWSYQSDDVFDGHTPTDDVLLGGTY